MTNVQKIEMMQTLVNDEEATDTLCAVYLADAGDAILRRRYPFGRPDDACVESQYDLLQVKLAVRYFLRRGGEGETSHNENGINRTYGSVNDEDLLMEVTSIGKVMGL